MALRQASREVLGETLAEQVVGDLIALQDTGLDRLGEQAAALRSRSACIAHDAAREIVAWLDGAWRITDEIVRTQ